MDRREHDWLFTSGGLYDVMYAVLYLLGCLSTMAATALAAIAMRKSHAMTRVQMGMLVILAGIAWPLLTVAAVQGAGLLGLAKGPRLLKSLIVRHPEPAEPPASVHRELAAVA